MGATEGTFRFLRSRHARVLTVLLAAQLAGLFAFSRKEAVPDTRPLDMLPAQLGSWSLVQRGTVEKEILDVLKADDVLTRTYADNNSPTAANLFVAFFKSQRTGQAPHSPKNCLPGSGWMQSQSDVVNISVP
ncbi:MAG TPA: EpsI family protein, partial [Bryobacteraceae bacterium]|nr:EpsI family protein [Bryobacteraceae bacterium]